MTREEAKTVFLNRGYVEVEGGTIYDADKWRESCRVISEWLEQEPCEDTISRQNDILPNIDKEVESYKKLLKHPVIKSIMGMDETQEQLDFVQPHKRIPVTLTVESDCISRQEAIDTIRQLYIDLAIQKYVIDILKALPSVKPQEKTGHWIADVDKWGDVVTTVNGYRCDKCNAFNTDRDNFCPNCGAKMESEQNG